jgi:hypothetical protein
MKDEIRVVVGGGDAWLISIFLLLSYTDAVAYSSDYHLVSFLCPL